MKINRSINHCCEVVNQRLKYHFTDEKGEWSFSKDTPYMKEFLNEVKTLSIVSSNTSNVLRDEIEFLQSLTRDKTNPLPTAVENTIRFRIRELEKVI